MYNGASLEALSQETLKLDILSGEKDGRVVREIVFTAGFSFQQMRNCGMRTRTRVRVIQVIKNLFKEIGKESQVVILKRLRILKLEEE